MLAKKAKITKTQVQTMPLQLRTTANNNATSPASATRLIRLPVVLERVGLSERTVYRYIASSTFPKPVKIGALSLWVESEVNAWLEARIAERDEEYV